MIYPPKNNNLILLNNVEINTVAHYINWTYFFKAWKVAGKYDGIEKLCLCDACESAWLQKIDANQREKAREALQLFRDAQRLLAEIAAGKSFSIKAVFQILQAKSENEGIIFFSGNQPVYIPMLRQQQKNEGGHFLSLSDFVSPHKDFVGVFATSVAGSDELCKKSENDSYKALLTQTLADRLAEATTEWLHEQIRKTYWGYAPNENLTVDELFKCKYQGIRPAVGYPALPDQSVIFLLDKILNFSQTGIKITENGSMYPTASICGLMFAHPQASYFVIGKIGDDQFFDYISRRGFSAEEAKKWLI